MNKDEKRHPEVEKYLKGIGVAGGTAVREKYGNEYFSKIAAKRKTFGRQGYPNSPTELAKRFKRSRSRIYQLLEKYSDTVDKKDYEDAGEWREAVLLKIYGKEPTSA